MAAPQRALPYGHYINGNGQLIFDSLTLPPYEGDRENNPQNISGREQVLRGLPRIRQCILNRRPIQIVSCLSPARLLEDECSYKSEPPT